MLAMYFAPILFYSIEQAVKLNKQLLDAYTLRNDAAMSEIVFIIQVADGRCDCIRKRNLAHNSEKHMLTVDVE